MNIKLQNAGLSDLNGEIIAQGFIDAEAMENLRIDDYQREIIPMSKGANLAKAVEAGKRLPSVVLGMRGERFKSNGSSFLLEDPVYVIDGQQRIAALRDYAGRNPSKAKNILIGAQVHFDTTKETEAEKFTILNTTAKRMAPAVLLRNMRNQYKTVLTIYGLTNVDQSFPLYNRVSWNQIMRRNDLLSALSIMRPIVVLHYTSGAVQAFTPRKSNLDSLEKVVQQYGLPVFRKNTHTFFSVIDEVWGIRNVAFKGQALQLKMNFLVALARMLRKHKNFWRGNTLFVNALAKRKLKGFPLHDPYVVQLCNAGGVAATGLYSLMVEHYNKGKRTQRLVPFVGTNGTMKGQSDDA